VPILAMSEHTLEQDKVTALEMGADDYVTKPLPMDELRARLRAALRRGPHGLPAARPPVPTGDLELDLERRRVLRAGRPVHLSPIEYDLLSLLATYPDKLLTYRMLLDGVWGPLRRPHKHTLHVYVARLRQKLELEPERPRYLVSEPRVGY